MKQIKETLFPAPKVQGLLGDIREAKFSGGLACLHCSSLSVKRHGWYRGRQCYLCKFTTPVAREFFINQLNDEKQYIFVASEDKNIVAVAVMKMMEISENPFMKDRRVLYINSLCVDKKEYGIGKRLMNFIIEFGKNLKVDSIELGESERNSSAIKFYESIGLTTKSRNMELRLKLVVEYLF